MHPKESKKKEVKCKCSVQVGRFIEFKNDEVKKYTGYQITLIERKNTVSIFYIEDTKWVFTEHEIYTTGIRFNCAKNVKNKDKINAVLKKVTELKAQLNNP